MPNEKEIVARLKEAGISDDAIGSIDPRDGGNTEDGQVLYLDVRRREAKCSSSR